jgi:hypothetical protein
MTTLDEREEIELLLPWYVTGKLSAAERQRVERFLADNPDIARQIELAREESAETVMSSEALGAPSAGSLDRLMQQVTAMPQRAGPMQILTGGLERLADWIGGLTRVQLGAVAVAAALLLAVQAGALLYMTERGSQTYETASGPTETAGGAGTFAVVSFRPTASAADIAALLSEAGAQIVEGPKAGGLWRVRLSAERLADAETEAKIALLRSKSAVISFASPE